MNKPPINILFVCYGNMCRSPIAEGLAKNILNGRVVVESAGTSPSRNRATDETIEIMHNEFDIDISNHRPRAVMNIQVEYFDFVIALDSYIYNCLQKDHRIDSEKLIEWDIEDPFGCSMDIYRECALHIQRCIKKFSKELQS